MGKMRIYNFLLLFALFCLLFVPILFLQTVKLFSGVCLILFCLLLSFNVEHSITFSIMKVTDQLKWVNDVGLGPVYALFKGLKWLFVCLVILSIIKDVNNQNMMSYMNLLTITHFLINPYCVYVGRNFIYIQGSYVPIEAITSIQQNTMNKGRNTFYTEFIIKVDKKTFTAKFNNRMHTGIDIFTQLSEKR